MSDLTLLHNLISNYKPYKIISEAATSMADNADKFIVTIYHDEQIILRAEHWILGSYSNEKNLWIWGDQSNVLEKNMCKKISALRKCLSNVSNRYNDPVLISFIDNNYSILTTSDLYHKLTILKSFLINDSCENIFGINKHRDIIASMGRKVLHFFVLERILSDNMKDF